MDAEEWVTTQWYTRERCPQCDKSLLMTNGWLEWCDLCEYSRKPIEADLDSEDDFHLAGLA